MSHNLKLGHSIVQFSFFFLALLLLFYVGFSHIRINKVLLIFPLLLFECFPFF